MPPIRYGRRGMPFWDRIVPQPSGCWEWQQGRHPKGYGLYRTPGCRVAIYAHRHAWALTHGPIPDGMFVCHHCDNPPCCNPRHLFLGSHTDNMADMAIKGRAARQRGIAHAMGKVPDSDVAAMRAMRWLVGMSNKDIAALFGVSSSWVCRVVNGKRR